MPAGRCLAAALAVAIGCAGPRAPAAEPGIKPLLAGLVAMGHIDCLGRDDNHCVNDNSFADASAMPGILRGVVVNMTWAQLEPAPFFFDLSPIDRALARIARYNSQYPEHKLRAILRVESASVAPDWVKRLAGAPVPIVSPSRRPITVPRFWTAGYRDAWRALQAKLAERYDREPLVAQISNTSCSHETDEPYVQPHDDPASFVALYDAGYGNRRYARCLLASIRDYDAWHATRVDFAQNPFENISVEPSQGGPRGVYGPLDLDVTIAIIKAFRSALGERAIISNHNLVSPPLPANRGLYQAMRALGGPIEFQTASAGVELPNAPPTGFLRDWDAAIRLGVDLGATAIEVWSSRVFAGRPVNHGWNPVRCDADVPSSECNGRPREDLLRWNRELETGRSPQ